MKIEFKKISKLTDEQLKIYKSQKCVVRKRESKGGYDAILSATDADLDRRKPEVI